MAEPGTVVLITYDDGQKVAYGIFEDSEIAGEWVAEQTLPEGASTEPVRFYAAGDRRQWHMAMRRFRPDSDRIIPGSELLR